MGSFGERLQREREMRRVTLEEISEHTRISTRNLRALEEENFSQLPGGIFNKGFVRAYAVYLGIDAEQAVSDMLAAEGEALRKKFGQLGPSGTTESEPTEAGTRLKLVTGNTGERPPERDQAAGFMRAAIALVVVLGVGGFIYKFMQGKPGGEPVQASSAPPPPRIESSRPPLSDTAPLNKPANNDAPPTPASRADERKEAVPVRIVPAASVPPELATDNGKVNLQIRTREESWVQVTADGKLLMEGILTASSSKSFAAEKELVVKLGNAAGVELSYNGKALPAFDPERRTRTLTFTPEGVQQ